MAKKYYAVRVGLTPGIYLTWPDCERQVKGYTGAQYKSFPTEAEARQFVYGDSTTGSPVVAGSRGATRGTKRASKVTATKDRSLFAHDTAELIAFIDGSFNKQRGIVGSGGVILVDGEEIEFSTGTREKIFRDYWNVSGELLAAIHVVKYAIEKSYQSCSLYYDYMGIEMWATGRWKTNNPLTTMYADKMKEWKQQIRIDFHKVQAHSGVYYNERADELAKRAITEYRENP